MNRFNPIRPSGDNCFLSASPEPARLLTSFSKGTQLSGGRYIIDYKITTGSCADIYLAEDRQINKQVVLKIFADTDNLDLFKNEARLQDRLSDSDYAVRVYDFHTVICGAAELFLISTEYAATGSFRIWLNNNKDNHDNRLNEGLTLFKQICQAVDAVHRANILHLDIKPGNFVFAGDRLKVIDFGTAAFIHTFGDNIKIPDWQGFIPATAEYMSPELFTVSFAGDLTVACDIYSLGVILFEIVHPDGRPPFTGSAQRIRSLHVNTGIGPEHLSRIDERYRSVIKRCLQRDPQLRFGSIKELLNELEVAVENKQEIEDVPDKAEIHDSASECQNQLPDRVIDNIQQMLTSVDIQRLNIEANIEKHQFDSALEKAQLLEGYISRMYKF